MTTLLLFLSLSVAEPERDLPYCNAPGVSLTDECDDYDPQYDDVEDDSQSI